MKDFIKAVAHAAPYLGIALVLAIVVISERRQTHSTALQAQNTQYVQQVCDAYRQTDSARLYRQCGDAQTKTHTEYLCDGGSIEASCWVEQK